MTKITIKKENEEITYSNVTTTHTFDVNGKKVRVYCYDKQDMGVSDYENDHTIEEDDLEKLTEEEHEAFGEDLYSYLALKEGEEELVEYEE
jgi:hypothetical protein